MTPLCELAKRHGTDKFSKHNYTPVYYSLFKDRTETVNKVFEIGIKTGASLRMWEEFFPNANIFGFDRKRRWLIKEGRIKSFLGDQGIEADLVAAACEAGGELDLIIDDGSHQSDHQVFGMLTLLPFLGADGIYVIEDVNDDAVVAQVPAGFFHEKIRTSDAHSDSVLLIVRRK